MSYPHRFCLFVLTATLFAVPAVAQEITSPPRDVAERSAEDLDELLGPIALYPDDLVALMLPAAAMPTDIVLAARFLDVEGQTSAIESQPWDESVRALANFPDVIEWMNQNLSWTQQIGEAFLAQPAAVMQSIQRLRARAHAAGTLRDTPQQRVLVDGKVIRIVSAEENVIYVPTYDTKVVYVDRRPDYYAPYFSFGIGWRVGNWHRWECDWYSHRVWVYDTHAYWLDRRRIHYQPHRYSYRPHYRYDFGGRAWSPPPHRVRRYQDNFRHSRRDVVRPGRYVENPSRGRIHGGRETVAGDRRGRPETNRDRRSDRPGVNAPVRPRVENPTPVVGVPPPARDTSRDYLTRSRNRPPGETTAIRGERTRERRSTTAPTSGTSASAPTPAPSRAAYTHPAPREVRAQLRSANPPAVQSHVSPPAARQAAPPPRADSPPAQRESKQTSDGSRDYLQRSRTTKIEDNRDSSRTNDGNSGGRSGDRRRGG